MIRKAKYEFPSPYWDEISLDAKDLIQKLLVVDPKKRLSGDQILKHPWIVNNTNERSLDHLKKKIYEYSSSMKKFKKMANVLKATFRLANIMKK
jgi:serine/threonine protein kinase